MIIKENTDVFFNLLFILMHDLLLFMIISIISLIIKVFSNFSLNLTLN